uniref:Nucleobase-ascorbate transporter 2 n=1 Tax=Oryza meridionalis TaxID=40149 RepID=A0A0E0C7Z8_9ORYZ
MIPAVLVPMMGGSDGDRVRVVQTLLFVTGINTLLQSLFGTRLPTVIGGSYAFVVPIMAIIQDSSLAAIPDDHESTASYKAAARLASATPPPAHILSRGIGWQGIGILLDGLFGTGTGSTVSVENVGLLGSTRIGSRRVIQISAGFMIFFSMLGKFGALFASIPFTIFAAVYCVLFGLVAAVGLSFLQFTNMNSMRNLFIVGVSIFLGLSVPEYFFRYSMAAQRGPAHTKAGWFNDYINTIFSSPPTVGLIVAVFLDNTLEVKNAAKDRGMPWWVPFRSFKGDARSEEFYSLPFNLNRFFPPS